MKDQSDLLCVSLFSGQAEPGHRACGLSHLGAHFSLLIVNPGFLAVASFLDETTTDMVWEEWRLAAGSHLPTPSRVAPE